MPLIRLLLCLCVLTACGLSIERHVRAADDPAQAAADPAEFVAGTNVNEVNLFEKYAGWELLFDGKDLDGWRNYKKDSIGDGWKVINGAIVRTDKGAGDLVTKDKYDSFELQLEFKISPAGNSGVMFHVTENNPVPWHSGPEIQINDNAAGHDPQKAGWLYQLYKPEKAKWMKQVEQELGLPMPDEVDTFRGAGEWNHLYLKITPGAGQVMLNGVVYSQFQLGSDDWKNRVAQSKFKEFPEFGGAGTGHICLQDHGNLVAFRNIKVRKLPASGIPKDPVDGELAIEVEPAFGDIRWEAWEPINERGQVNEMRPVCITNAGDGSNRLFFGTQDGMIYTLPQGASEAKLFLDLRPNVMHFKKGHNEEGLLGLAFHPDYKENGELFVYYTKSEPGHTSIISRFRVSEDDANRANPQSEEIVMTIDEPFGNHNGGSIEFGPDGYLYIGLGDGGSGNDPLGNGQNLGTLLGKILRIDVDSKQGDLAYGIPQDNPFVKLEGARPEIFAYGFRNPWRISFDRKTGHLWEGEVGQDYWEEVQLIEKGGNYGWSEFEGTWPFGNRSWNTPSEPTGPVWEYDHLVGKSITGGFVYRGQKLPELDGVYLYADYVTGKIWGLKYDTDARQVEWNKSIPSQNMAVLAFGEDEQGEVYCSIATAAGNGIYRFFRSKP